MTTVHGLACRIDNRSLRVTIGRVLAQIRQRRPSDYRRLKARLRRFRYLPQSAVAQGLGGQARKLGKPPVRPKRLLSLAESAEFHRTVEAWPYLCPYEVLLPRSLASEPTWLQCATIAHELGHVALRRIDEIRRSTVDDRWFTYEWTLELVADWYAYGWGFGRDIRRHGPRRDVQHHFIAPGSELTFESGGRFRLTRRFVFRRITQPRRPPTDPWLTV